jgi:NADP-dependent alcohol dehydrogenase
MLTAKYGIDHGATLAILTKPFLESQFEARKAQFAESGSAIFGVTGSTEERARGLIDELQKYIVRIGQPTKVSEWPDVVIGPNDVEELVASVLKWEMGSPTGWKGCCTAEVMREVYSKVVK